METRKKNRAPDGIRTHDPWVRIPSGAGIFFKPFDAKTHHVVVLVQKTHLVVGCLHL